MRGHHDLADRGLLHPPHQFQELHLARRRQRRFRFVENENALPLATLLEEAQKALAVRMREEVWPSRANVVRGLVEISGDRKETFGPEEPAVGNLRQPACTKRARKFSTHR